MATAAPDYDEDDVETIRLKSDVKTMKSVAEELAKRVSEDFADEEEHQTNTNADNNNSKRNNSDNNDFDQNNSDKNGSKETRRRIQRQTALVSPTTPDNAGTKTAPLDVNRNEEGAVFDEPDSTAVAATAARHNEGFEMEIPNGARASTTSGDAPAPSSDGALQRRAQFQRQRQKTMKERFREAIEKGTFKFFFQHPILRLFTAFIVTFFNFVIYLEDPVPHSQLNAAIPLIGHAFSLVLTKYPSSGGMIFLKILFWVTGIALGMILGMLLHHQLLRRFLPHMFGKSRGSWMIMFLTTLITLFVMSLIYSAAAAAAGEPVITSDLGIKDELFMKFAATGTWIGDLLTFCMVFDLIMQDAKNHDAFQNWATSLRSWWCSEKFPHRRIVIFWVFVVVTTIIVIGCIFQPFFSWDDHFNDWYLIGKPLFPNNQVWRIALASIILSLDLYIVMQDWTFPGFEEGDLNLKLPGLNRESFVFVLYSKAAYEAAKKAVDDPEHRLRSTCVKSLYSIRLWFLRHLCTLGEIEITGKWFNYGVLAIVMLLDANMLKNQIVYDPASYCQYTIEHDRICVINDLNQIGVNGSKPTDPPKVTCYEPFPLLNASSISLPSTSHCLSGNHTRLTSLYTPGLGAAPGLLFLIPLIPALISLVVVLKRPDWRLPQSCCGKLRK